jgi:osmotically-inducible protein OsmY
VITTRVKAALVRDPDLSAIEINVETFRGVVQLSGFVDTQAEINKAGQVARAVAGVEAVQNDIALK